MKRRDFLSVTAGIAGAGITGCTDFADSADFDVGTPSPDSGMMEDSGREDSGPEMDAGPTPEDAGPAPEDAGPGDMDAGPMPMCVSITIAVGDDHPKAMHAEGLTIPAADVATGEAQTYDITGAGSHGHNIMLSPDNFTSLAAGEMVSIESDGAGHTHTVTLQCMS